MEYGAHAVIPLHVVPYQSESAHSVEIEVVEREVAKVKNLVVLLATCALVANGSRERDGSQPVMSEHPVVSVTARQGNVGIVDFLRVGSFAHISACHVLAQLVRDDGIELVPVYAERMLGVAYSAQSRTA